MLISLDVSRHKEIVTKAIVGFILLLMKHLKNNHINQFENLSHHLYGSNCFPLIAKFFNQNMTMFVTQRNQIPKLDLRNAIRGTVFSRPAFSTFYCTCRSSGYTSPDRKSNRRSNAVLLA
jgi:hypothetical protein